MRGNVAKSPGAARATSAGAASSSSFPLLLEGKLEEELLCVLVPQRPELALRLVNLTGRYLHIGMIKLDPDTLIKLISCCTKHI